MRLLSNANEIRVQACMDRKVRDNRGLTYWRILFRGSVPYEVIFFGRVREPFLFSRELSIVLMIIPGSFVSGIYLLCPLSSLPGIIATGNEHHIWNWNSILIFISREELHLMAMYLQLVQMVI